MPRRASRLPAVGVPAAPPASFQRSAARPPLAADHCLTCRASSCQGRTLQKPVLHAASRRSAPGRGDSQTCPAAPFTSPERPSAPPECLLAPWTGHPGQFGSLRPRHRALHPQANDILRQPTWCYWWDFTVGFVVNGWEAWVGTSSSPTHTISRPCPRIRKHGHAPLADPGDSVASSLGCTVRAGPFCARDGAPQSHPLPTPGCFSSPLPPRQPTALATPVEDPAALCDSPPANEIVAVGDLHGDLASCGSSRLAAGIARRRGPGGWAEKPVLVRGVGISSKCAATTQPENY